MTWKEVEGYEGRYLVSDSGLVFSISTNTYLKKFANKKGYFSVRVWGKSGGKNFKIHRLVAIHFLENERGLKEVNHKNGLKSDNRVENLEWCTHSENMQHSWDNGLHRKAPAHFNVSFVKKVNRWRLQFGSKYLGNFKSKEEAFASVGL